MDTQKILAAATKNMRSGSLAKAESDCRSILAMFPRHYHALSLLAEILKQAERETEALVASHWAEMSTPGVTSRFTEHSTELFRAAFGPAVSPLETIQNKHRVQMRSLGQNGRFGNQVLQYAFVRLYARQHDLIAEFPDWIGRDIYDFDDPFPSEKLPTVDETEADLFGSLSGRTGHLFSDRDISGYFCGNTQQWAEWRVQFCALFEPGQKVRALLGKALDNLRSRGNTIVAIHLRRGDFGYGRFWVAPSSWYITWLKTIWARLHRPVLYIASDLPGSHEDFAEFNAWSADHLGVDIPGADFLIDHHILRHADYLAISNSSFSFTAAMLNGQARSFLRPDPNLRELVTFAPWSCPVLWDADVNVQAIAADEKTFIQNRILRAGSVVYWGSYCSAWTNFARTVHGRLRILEIEADASVSDTLRRRNIRHVQLLVLENPKILSQFFDSASEIFDQAKVDGVLLHLDAEARAGLVSNQFAAKGYVVFRLKKNALLQVSPDNSNLRGSYVAIRRPLAASFKTHVSVFDFNPRNLLVGLSRWITRH